MGCGASRGSKDCGAISSLPTTSTGAGPAGHLVEKQGAGGDLGPNSCRTQVDNAASNSISTYAKLAPVLGMAIAATTPLLDFVPFGAGAALGKLLEIAKVGMVSINAWAQPAGEFPLPPPLWLLSSRFSRALACTLASGLPYQAQPFLT